ncbi:MAG: PAS domain-containing sensor histidine kinase, partial [Caulobacteraceae bacterium]
MESEAALPLLPDQALGRSWMERLESRPLIWTGYGASALLTAAAVGLGSSPSLSGPLGPASPLVLTLLAIDFVIILGLGALIAWRVWRLAAGPGDAGARLHLRFVALFAAAAALPALIVALFFGVLVTRGIESWFNARVQSVVEESAKTAHSYLNEQSVYTGDHTTLVAQDLDAAGPGQLAASPVAFAQFLFQQAQENGFAGAYVIDARGRILANALTDGAPPYLTPSAHAFQEADAGYILVQPFKQADVIRGLYRLRAFPGAYLYVVWPVDPGVFAHLRKTEASIGAYREARAHRGRIEFGFFLSYLQTVLWV